MGFLLSPPLLALCRDRKLSNKYDCVSEAIKEMVAIGCGEGYLLI